MKSCCRIASPIHQLAIQPIKSANRDWRAESESTESVCAVAILHVSCEVTLRVCAPRSMAARYGAEADVFPAPGADANSPVGASPRIVGPSAGVENSSGRQFVLATLLSTLHCRPRYRRLSKYRATPRPRVLHATLLILPRSSPDASATIVIK
jgi:hypothetical protein